MSLNKDFRLGSFLSGKLKVHFFLLEVEVVPGIKMRSLSSRFLTMASIVCEAAIRVSHDELVTRDLSLVFV